MAENTIGVLSSIEADYQIGNLSLNEKVQLEIKAIKYFNELPEIYKNKSLSTGIESHGCASVVLLDIRRNWESLSKETQDLFTLAFARDSSEFTYISESGFFKFHYDTSGTNSIPEADDDFSGVPDYIEKISAYCDTSLDWHLNYGFLMPPSDGILGGDSLYDIYFLETGLYGYTFPEGSGGEPWNDSYSYIVLNNDFLGFTPNNDPEGDQAGAAKVTCAHEFHHACQYAYDVSEASWIIEADATCLEDLVFDQVDDNYQYLDSFFVSPEKSIMANGPHAYSSFIWNLYLADRFDTTLLVAMWEGGITKTVFDALKDSIAGRYGWSLDSAFSEFAAWNYCTGTRSDGLHHVEADMYPMLDFDRIHSSYPVNLLTSPTNPAGYGACYIEFLPSGVPKTLELSFNGDNSREWEVYIIKSTTENSHEFEKMVLDPVNFDGAITIKQFESYLRVVMVGVNVLEYSSGSFFNYSASVHPPYEVTTQIMTVDSAVYSGGMREFEYLVSNPSTIYNVYRITAWDDSGWINMDYFDIPVLAGEDSLVTIPVTPPDGVPFGNISTLSFRATSRLDTTVFDIQNTGAKAVLQRGDANFDGDVLVSDLVYMVNYIFKGGPAPLPIEDSGDFSCVNGINVVDLTDMVKYLFKGGSPSPCNPY
ncbi:MAG: MXAN_6640 family putative metalloprotease [bacterium]